MKSLFFKKNVLMLITFAYSTLNKEMEGSMGQYPSLESQSPIILGVK